MSMIDAYCVDEVIILVRVGEDEWGEPMSANVKSIKGYVEWKSQLVRNQKGEEVESSVMVRLSKRRVRRLLGRDLIFEDRIVVDQGGVEVYGNMPGASLDRAIIDIRQPKDFSSPHLEVYLA